MATKREFGLTLGLFFLHWTGQHPRKRNKFALFRFLLALIYTLIGFGLNIAAIIINYNGFESLALTADAVSGVYQAIVKAIITQVLKSKLAAVLDKVDSFWANDIFGYDLKVKIHGMEQICRKGFVVYNFFMWGTILLYLLKPILINQIPTIIYLPCDIDTSTKCYSISLGIQIFYVVFPAIAVVGIDCTFFSLIFHAYRELEKIKYGLLHLSINENEVSEEQALHKFSRIVKYHNFILDYIRDINALFRFPLLNQFFSSTQVICFAIFFLTVDGIPPTLSHLSLYGPYVIVYYVQLFTYCFVGEMISVQGRSVAEAAFESRWHVKYQPRLTNGIVLVIQMARVSPEITIGQFWILGFDMFVKIMKTSFSFFTFLQTVFDLQ